MTDVAKRKITESWRQAVASRSGRTAPGCLDAYDAWVAAGRAEAEAAFRALDAHGLLWRVDEPYGPATTADAGMPASDEDGVSDL